MLRCFFALLLLASGYSHALFVNIKSGENYFFANIRLQPDISVEWVKKPPDAAATAQMESLIHKYVQRYRQQLMNFRPGSSVEPQQLEDDYEFTYQPGYVMHYDCSRDYDEMASH